MHTFKTCAITYPTHCISLLGTKGGSVGPNFCFSRPLYKRVKIFPLFCNCLNIGYTFGAIFTLISINNQKSPNTSILNLLDITSTLRKGQGVSLVEERGKEEIHIRAYQPILNKDGSRFKLPNSYDQVLTSLTSKVKDQFSRNLGHSAEKACRCNS